jgi:hypothetical protein
VALVATTSSSMHAARFTAVSRRFQPVVSLTASSHDVDEGPLFEDALAGVAAGRAGGFGFVVGVDRTGHADALRTHGADVVVSDLTQLLDSA